MARQPPRDRHLGGWRHWNGIDLVALLRAALLDLPRGQVRGASTLPMMLVRAMNHRNADPDEGFAAKLTRKFTEWRDTPVLYLRLKGDGMAGLRQWLAMHVPLVQGAAGSGMGSPLYGLGSAAQVLFGKRVGELAPAEQAILAAAFFRPVLLAAEDDERGGRLAALRWQRLKARAARGLRLAALDPAMREAALDRLHWMAPPRPQVDPALARWLPADPAARFAVAANPERRALHFARGLLGQLIGELEEAYGPEWRRHVRTVRLTLAADRQLPFLHEIEARFAPLIKAAHHRPQRIAALADGEGRLLHFYASGEDSIYGGIRAYRGRDGRYDPQRERRAIGSLGKIAVALHLGRAGDRPEAHYCDRALAADGHRFRDPGGGHGVARCSGRGAWYTARQVYARSLNLPLLWRLRRVGDHRLQPLVAALGLTRPDPATPLRTALPLGMVAASPQRLHGIVLALARAAAGRGGATPLPHLIETRVEADGQARPAAPAGRIGDLAPWLGTAAARHYVTTVLGAVVAPGGTAQRLADWSAGRHPRVTLHLAKSGTTTDARRATVDAYLAGGLRFDGHPYGYFALLGSGRPDTPLGAHLGGSSLAPVARALLSALAEVPTAAAPASHPASPIPSNEGEPR